MQMTAVYFCVRILSEAVASLSLRVYKYNGDGGKEKAVKHTESNKRRFRVRLDVICRVYRPVHG